MKKCLKEQGITLIALVVTIIILLILAGVTIGLATNGTGLFEKAKLATDEYNNSVEKENTEIEKISNEIDNYINSDRQVSNNQLLITIKSPTIIRTWTKVADYPTGYTKDNTFIIGKIKGSDGRIRIIPYFDTEWHALLSTEDDGIHMYVEYEQSDKDVYLLLIKSE